MPNAILYLTNKTSYVVVFEIVQYWAILDAIYEVVLRCKAWMGHVGTKQKLAIFRLER